MRPFPGLGTNWVTEITQVAEPHYFIDEQRFGPYKFWHHQHWFHETDGGVLAEDIIHYALPFAPLSTPFHRLLVRPQLDGIFAYREQVLSELFARE